MKRPAATAWWQVRPHKRERGQCRKWRPAMDKIGIDVHKVATQACVLTEDGEYAESRIRTERDALTTFFGQRPRARILVEAATESEWVARHLESLGHEVTCKAPGA
jgi:transposase